MHKSTHSSEYRQLLLELRRFRDEAGLSQRDLALRLDVPHSWVAKVETGERRIDLVEFCWFLKACGADPIKSLPRILRKAERTSGGRTQ